MRDLDTLDLFLLAWVAIIFFAFGLFLLPLVL